MKKSPKKTILLVANGDLRQSANEKTWSGQEAMERQLTAAVAKLAFKPHAPFRARKCFIHSTTLTSINR